MRTLLAAAMLAASIVLGAEPWEAPGAPPDEAACARLMGSADFDEREEGSARAALLPAESSRLMLSWARATDDPEVGPRLERAAVAIFDRSVLPGDARWRGARGWIGLESRTNADARARYNERCEESGEEPGREVDDPEVHVQDPRPLHGRMILEVFPVTPADAAGLRPRDVVTLVDGRDPVSFMWRGSEGFPAGVTRKLRVFRPRAPEGGWAEPFPGWDEYSAEGADGEWLDVEITGEERPEGARDAKLEQWVREDALRAWFGIGAGAKAPAGGRDSAVAIGAAVEGLRAAWRLAGAIVGALMEGGGG